MHSEGDHRTQPARSIAIIGAGYSGSMLAVHLLRLAREHAAGGLHIFLLDRSGTFGPGVAYSTLDPDHLLNVPAGFMSAFPDDPGHFLAWLREQRPRATVSTFAPRFFYGNYLRHVIRREVENLPAGASIEMIDDEAMDAVVDASGRAAVRLRGGRVLESDAVVLALGNLPPGQAAANTALMENNDRYIANFWTSTHRLDISRDASVLVIGSGLTMVDAVTSLENEGHTGRVTVVSRRGLLPTRHRPVPAYAPFLDPGKTAPASVRLLLRQVRQEVAAAARREIDWRAVIDSLRPVTPALWSGLPRAEKRRFLRHVRPYWEVARHRLAPEVADRFQRLLDSRRLELVAARIRHLAPDPAGFRVVWRRKGQAQDERRIFDFVINCVGPECDFRRVEHPLIRGLVGRGVVTPDAVGMGIDVNDEGAVLDAAGRASAVFYALGPLRKGDLWETTAVPELRTQTQALARKLLSPVS